MTCRDDALIRLFESNEFDHSSCNKWIGLLIFFRRCLFGSGLNENARLRRLFALWRPLKFPRLNDWMTKTDFLTVSMLNQGDSNYLSNVNWNRFLNSPVMFANNTLDDDSSFESMKTKMDTMVWRDDILRRFTLSSKHRSSDIAFER